MSNRGLYGVGAGTNGVGRVRDDTQAQTVLSQPNNLEKLVTSFVNSLQPIFVNMVEPMFRVVQSCTEIQLQLTKNKEFVSCLLRGLLDKKFDNLVRLKLMKMLVSLCEVHPNFTKFSKSHKLRAALRDLREDNSILIVELAQQLHSKYLSKKHKNKN